jgi:hypothetical protein
MSANSASAFVGIFEPRTGSPGFPAVLRRCLALEIDSVHLGWSDISDHLYLFPGEPIFDGFSSTTKEPIWG